MTIKKSIPIKTFFSRANQEYKNGNIEDAIKLYELALSEAEGTLKERIRFNLNYAKKKLGCSEIFEDKDINEYIPRLDSDAKLTKKAVRAIAFYLPQYHSIPENDDWWGKGFTEWINVKKSQPKFHKHYQPRIPDPYLGYYNLLDGNTQAKQVELAKQYGIEGFCFYYYWFSGKQLLQQPIQNYLSDKSLDLPFCICWANENWSRRWDGLNDDVLIQQNHSEHDDIEFIISVSKFLRDSRYIKINGRPLMLVYRPNLFPEIKATVSRWRTWCRSNGIGEIYLVYPQSFESVDPAEYGFDAACEFPPNNSAPPKFSEELKIIDNNFEGEIYDWKILIERSENYQNSNYKLFRGAAPSWDNTPRKNNKGIIFHDNSPKLFERWLTNAFIDTCNRYVDQDERVIFINAWNEWGEGAYLEPDQRYGFAWLAAVRQAHHNTLSYQKSPLNGQTLLFVDYSLPLYDQFAGSRTNFMYLKVLLRLGMKIIYLPSDFKNVEPYSSELKDLGVEVLAGDNFKENWPDWFSKNGDRIDYAFLHKPEPALKFISDIINKTKAALVYQCHDLHYLRLERQAEFENNKDLKDIANIFREKENYLFSVCDSLLTFSSTEESIIRNGFPNKPIYTVPLYFYDNALDDLDKAYKDRLNLLYVGGFGHTPNRDAVIWFCQKVLPIVTRDLPGIIFNVVGDNPPEEIKNIDNVNILGRVSDEDLEALYKKTRLSLIPLRFGAGVKGKVIEAMYYGVPIVSTTIGLEGIKDIDMILSAKDSPDSYAKEIVRLYTNEKEWNVISNASKKFINDNFTSYQTGKLLEEILLNAKINANKRYSINELSIEKNPLRTIAFHLPQYHPIPENNLWWGEGFTEWRNVSKAKPLFEEHYQPHIPADLGFYDLRLEEARVAQADLAKEFGISGFCYYHYWFNGKRLIERPVEEILVSGKPNFPFCLCWANENWTRRWDGEDSNILMEQVYSDEDDKAHIRDLLRFFRDSRYIKVDGRPLFLVYRTENMPDPARTAKIWRDEARDAGIGEIYLVRVDSIGRVNPLTIGFDAALEFAPDWGKMGGPVKSYSFEEKGASKIVQIPEYVQSKNYIRSYPALIEQMLDKEQPPYPWFRCVTPSWDNSARKLENAVILLEASPDRYQKWLENIVVKTYEINRSYERIVFINAWNEWAEGNHLEPCHKWGRSYLDATKKAVKDGEKKYSDQNYAYHKTPKFIDDLIGKELSNELAISMLSYIDSNPSTQSLTISFEVLSSASSMTYMKGWAAINDQFDCDGYEILILIKNIKVKPRLVSAAKIIRNDITNYFSNGRSFDGAGFEAKVDLIEPGSDIFLIIRRDNENFWQQHQ
jgi:lipopolysaccharide biosynthesis protein